MIDRLQQPFQSDPCEALTMHGVIEPSHRQSQPAFAQMHATRTERVFGDHYGLCLTCGARSEAIVRRDDAEAWTCPIGDAERQVARNLDRFAFRVREAQRDGYFAFVR